MWHTCCPEQIPPKNQCTNLPNWEALWPENAYKYFNGCESLLEPFNGSSAVHSSYANVSLLCPKSTGCIFVSCKEVTTYDDGSKMFQDLDSRILGDNVVRHPVAPPLYCLGRIESVFGSKQQSFLFVPPAAFVPRSSSSSSQFTHPDPSQVKWSGPHFGFCGTCSNVSMFELSGFVWFKRNFVHSQNLT